MASRDFSHGRGHLATADHELASGFGRVMDLFQRAFPTRAAFPEFARRVNFANSQGCTWIEALEFAASRADAPIQTKNSR